MRLHLVEPPTNPLLSCASAAARTKGIDVAQVREWPRHKMEDLLTDCYNQGHWSVFEFADWDFEVIGVSRVLETQSIRSRVASFEWETGRMNQEYTIAPAAIQACPEIGAAVGETISTYEDLVGANKHPEDARYALAQGVSRSGRIKRNHRNLMETCLIRLCNHAQFEYRDLMYQCKDMIHDVEPYLATLLVPKCEWYLYCNEKKSCRRGGCLTKDEVRELIQRRG